MGNIDFKKMEFIWFKCNVQPIISVKIEDENIFMLELIKDIQTFRNKSTNSKIYLITAQI